MNVYNSAWDKKSKKYNKFDGNLSPFQKEFFEILAKFGIEFKDKTLVDIGCGTGVYSLFLAGICKSVLGVDGSSGMLEELAKKANEFEIKNIRTIHANFDEFCTDESFDIAFLTMSPALKNEVDFKKFISLATKRIYLNWEKPRHSSMLEPFFAKFGKSGWENVTKTLKNYLEDKNIAYKTEILDEKRVACRTFDEAYENVLWHLQINGFEYDKIEIRAMLEKQCDNGVVKDEIISQMRVLVF
ncbi:class I SAM-dependent methyltransferase [Campylobacter geochelonis]|uniref:Flagellar basal-body rod protein n=1 Tax=Campylobacter geochelonis TaxID=1780362 RepID=A0A128EDJ7_9BACT|nr:class I SAM-dependent methyltransferase [Campylobacter geochelonis]QKF70489.1 SAM-dependent methyltransferase [Campylobacter geochelonis]CZE46178.1 flagellar basal-body rod protein [Campylobacter geochelonis]CZE46452.1 flagellar basal-body rod protein [Campylobacter geochelonis]